MRPLVILFLFVLLVTASPVSGEPELVDLTIRCPGAAEIVDVNFKNHLNGSYSDSTGKSGNLDFEGEGGTTRRSIPYASLRRDGQTIVCEYRGECQMLASYRYRVKRDIVSCVTYSGNREMRCKVKP